MNASIGVAFASEPASSGRRPGIFRTMSAVHSIASMWSEQISTSESIGWSIIPSSLAGRCWSAAATCEPGQAAWTLAATDPRGGTRGWNSPLMRASAFAMQMTTLPSRWGATETAVSVAPSHAVANTTTSHWAAPALSDALMSRFRPGHLASVWSRISSARSFEREPITTSRPADASRAASALPAGPVPPRMPICTSWNGTRRNVGRSSPIGGPMGLLDGKKILVTGVLTDASIAFAVADLAI